jgi:hypothetical protein
VVALLLEIGLLLVLIPWSRFWERNYFADVMPVVHFVITNNYVRGAVSGLGLINIWLALLELGGILGQRDDAMAAGQDG